MNWSGDRLKYLLPRIKDDNLNEIARSFVKDHKAEYLDFLGTESARFFRNRVYITWMIGAITLVNMVLYSWELFWLYLPALAFAYLGTYFSEWTASKGWGKYRSFLPDIFLFGVILPSSACSHMLLDRGFESLNAPLMTAITIGSAISFHTRRDSIRRTLLFSAIICVVILLLYNVDGKSAKYMAAALVQATVGSFIGNRLSIMHATLLEIKFLESVYMTSQVAHRSEQMGRTLYPHQNTALGRFESYESTMPIGTTMEGVSFIIDVQNSSGRDSPKIKEALNIAIGMCKKHLDRTYEEEGGSGPVCDAYRHKDAFDGFICTIGFPFKLPKNRDGQSPESVALEISQAFIDIFSEVFNRLIPEEIFFMAVGIERGELEGYFTDGKPIAYELRGKAIVNASRLEQFRKDIFYETGTLNSNIIIISQEVRDRLTGIQKAAFQRYDLAPDQKIKSMDSVRVVYVHLSNELMKLPSPRKKLESVS